MITVACCENYLQKIYVKIFLREKSVDRNRRNENSETIRNSKIVTRYYSTGCRQVVALRLTIVGP